MKAEAPDRYLWRQILSHVSLFYDPAILALLEETRIVFTSVREAYGVRGPAIAIPIDIPFDAQPRSPFSVPFNGTALRLWHPLEPPADRAWKGCPEGDPHPLWYRHDTGTHTPAWNLFGNLLGLMTFQEERQSPARDHHGRFAAGFSPRAAAELLEVPAFNDAVAALVGACIGLRQQRCATMQLGTALKRPVIVLSHDCDILRGNDCWTQGIRAYRAISPLTRGRPPALGNLWWVLRNALRPCDFYLDNVPGLVTLERMFGSTSTFYLLNGPGGRFGARSGSSVLPRVVAEIPRGWDIGMHYGYDAFLDEDQFSMQRRELADLIGHEPAAGRAHYLRFDPMRSLSFLSARGISVDESAGYSDRIGYRCGIGGCFQGYDPDTERALDIWEIPMTVMDDVILSQYGNDAIPAFERLLQHLSRVGGALSVVFHPGSFYNPEFARMLGLYHKILIASRDLGCGSATALALHRSIPTRFRNA